MKYTPYVPHRESYVNCKGFTILELKKKQRLGIRLLRFSSLKFRVNALSFVKEVLNIVQVTLSVLSIAGRRGIMTEAFCANSV